jgi:hypothetical protein
MSSMRAAGRALQFIGLGLLPLGMAVQLAGGLSLGQMLVMAVLGVSAFWVGRIVEGYS